MPRDNGRESARKREGVEGKKGLGRCWRMESNSNQSILLAAGSV